MSEKTSKSIIWTIFSPMFGLLRGSRNKCKTEQIGAGEAISDPGVCGKARPTNPKQKKYHGEIKKYISYDTERNKFRVRIQGVYVGRYKTLQAAITVRNRVCKELNILIMEK